MFYASVAHSHTHIWNKKMCFLNLFWFLLYLSINIFCHSLRVKKNAPCILSKESSVTSQLLLMPSQEPLLGIGVFEPKKRCRFSKNHCLSTRHMHSLQLWMLFRFSREDEHMHDYIWFIHVCACVCVRVRMCVCVYMLSPIQLLWVIYELWGKTLI